MGIWGERIKAGEEYRVQINKPFEWIITGMPRSGTLFSCHMLQENEIPCSHEDFFHYRLMGGKPDHTDKNSEASWLAALFLRDLDVEKIVVLVRDPLKVISSHFLLGSLEMGSKTDFNKTVREVCPTVQGEATRLDKIIRFYIDWYRMIEAQLQGRSNYIFMSSEELFTSPEVEIFGTHFELPGEVINSKPLQKKRYGFSITQDRIQSSPLFAEAQDIYTNLTQHKY